MDAVMPEVRQDPNTGAIAVRRGGADDDPTAWGVMDPATGGSYAPSSHVAGWPKLRRVDEA